LLAVARTYKENTDLRVRADQLLRSAIIRQINILLGLMMPL